MSIDTKYVTQLDVKELELKIAPTYLSGLFQFCSIWDDFSGYNKLYPQFHDLKPIINSNYYNFDGIQSQSFIYESPSHLNLPIIDTDASGNYVWPNDCAASPCEPPVPPSCEPTVTIPEQSGGIYGDPHVDVISRSGSHIEFDHNGYNGRFYHIFNGDDMAIDAKYEYANNDPNAPKFITETAVRVNGSLVTYNVDGQLTINGDHITQPGQYDIGNGGYIQLNQDNSLGEHTLELHNDQDSKVDFWTNGTEMKVDPSGTYVEKTVYGLIGDTFMQNAIPQHIANAPVEADAYLIPV